MASQHPYDLDRLEKTSRTTGIATLVGALIVIGSLVFGTWRLTSMQNEVEELQARSADLNQRIAERQSQLDELGALITAAQTELEELEVIEAGMDTPRTNPQMQAEVAEKSENVRRTLDRAVATYSKIKEQAPISAPTESRSTVVDMQLCKRVENLDPLDCGATFEASTIYVWARLDVPQKESVTVRWTTSAGETVRETSINVDKSPGYRIFDPITLSPDKAGAYVVYLLDGAGNEIGNQRFTVTS